MVQVECINKTRDKSGNITKYLLVDAKGFSKEMSARDLKLAIKRNQLYVNNLTLTKNDRLIDKAKNENNLAYNVGDKIRKKVLDKMYAFTCMESNENKVIFLCDEIIGLSKFNKDYQKPNANKYANSILEKSVQGIDKNFTIPTKEQIEKWYKYDNQRIARQYDNPIMYWLSSTSPNESSAFCVTLKGNIRVMFVHYKLGIRPCFEIKNTNKKTKNKSTNETIKQYYTKTYKTDSLGKSINDKITFDDLYECLRKHEDVYDLLGVGDSIIRERVFGRLSQIKNVDYNTIYSMWLA